MDHISLHGLCRPCALTLWICNIVETDVKSWWFHPVDRLSKWDIAAGALLVKEAGGMVSDFNEKQAWLKTGNIVAANAKIYGDFIKIIQKNMSEELKNQ